MDKSDIGNEATRQHNLLKISSGIVGFYLGHNVALPDALPDQIRGLSQSLYLPVKKSGRRRRPDAGLPGRGYRGPIVPYSSLNMSILSRLRRSPSRMTRQVSHFHPGKTATRSASGGTCPTSVLIYRPIVPTRRRLSRILMLGANRKTVRDHAA